MAVGEVATNADDSRVTDGSLLTLLSRLTYCLVA